MTDHSLFIRHPMSGRLASALLLLLFGSATSSAQQSMAPPAPGGASRLSGAVAASHRTKETVTIALFETFSMPHLDAVIRRTKGNSGAVLIAVKRSALSQPLLAALMAAVPTSSGKMRPESDRFDVYFREGAALPRAQSVDPTVVDAVLKGLGKAAPQQIQGLGKYPAITITL